MTAVVDTTPPTTAPEPLTPAPKRRRRNIVRPVAFYVVFFLIYAIVGYWLCRVGYVNPDAAARVGNAGYTMMSRYPHLGAVGFVWNPLPSFVEIPLFRLTYWNSFIRTTGYVGAIQSALFMAGAVFQVRGIAFDRQVSTLARWLAIATFAFHPMVVFYGGDGMSEGAELFLLLWACRHLLRWLRSDAPVNLVMCGVALALCYLTRIEAVIALTGTGVIVFAVSTVRNRPGWGWRGATQLGIHDAVVVSFLPLFAALTWALSSWLLVGSLFDSLTSQYGNTAQVAASGIGTLTQAVGFDGITYNIAAQLLGMQPLVIVVVAMALVRAVRQRCIDIMAPLAMFGSILVFQVYAIYTAATFGWFRFFITAVPLAVVALLVTTAPGRRGDRIPFFHSRRSPVWMVPMLVFVLISSFPAAWASMMNPAIGKEEFGVRAVIWPNRYSKSEHWAFWGGELSRNTAVWFDNQNLPDGSVLVDTFSLAKTWLASNHPKQFTIRSDYDFFDKVNSPLTNGVRYILVPKPTGLGELDAINLRYPTMWVDGAGLATLALSVVNPQGFEQFRIYQINGSA
ncbi:hypothetical protein ORI20_20810 [Mycobacterium sp. CVI_P3]|uniref:Glycosyltransferase RgtA/B/C/D-like domain-containing protein n=1 Tax=Mycobacterium pinniadriaticum TaxID=2994102 RepID=A0ABT3SIM4_9MYCO|nr:hypothetical protein [Mycobacterium pinniadriaticum]MCX2932718.1 hypothetical protein [Mycobacterium pinniadriaticum]MCX2939222.1 hypothetical protein [Mycobacterium pinniadriaticum]